MAAADANNHNANNGAVLPDFESAPLSDEDDKRLGNETFSLTTTLGENCNSGKEMHADDQLLPGIQLDAVRSFSGQPEREIRVTPIIVDFRTLLLSKTEVEIVKGVS